MVKPIEQGKGKIYSKADLLTPTKGELKKALGLKGKKPSPKEEAILDRLARLIIFGTFKAKG